MAAIDILPATGDFIALGGKPQSGFDAPTDAQDDMPTHIDMLGQGGLQVHQTTASIFAIPQSRRQRMMECNIWGAGDPNVGKKLVLRNIVNGGINDDIMNNNNWIETVSPTPTLPVLFKRKATALDVSNGYITIPAVPSSIVDIEYNGVTIYDPEDWSILGDTITFSGSFILIEGSLIAVRYYI